MKISEIFRSVQGEGVYIGVPSTFVRVAGCNLSCAWCDTEYAGANAADFRHLGVEEIGGEALRYGTRHVVITGGEPLIYRHEIKKLCEFLHQKRKYITIETNATLFASGLKADFLSLSPKLPSARQKNAVKLHVIRNFLKNYRCQLKFVVDGERDLAACMALLSKLKGYRFDGPILQPVGAFGRYRDKLAALVRKVCIDENQYSEFFREYKNFRVLPQLHRVIFGAKRGV